MYLPRRGQFEREGKSHDQNVVRGPKGPLSLALNNCKGPAVHLRMWAKFPDGPCRVSLPEGQAGAARPRATPGYEEPPKMRSVVSQETNLQLQTNICYHLQFSLDSQNQQKCMRAPCALENSHNHPIVWSIFQL